MTRAFIALDLPEALKVRLAETSLELKRELGGAVRWLRPDAMHLTLKFFGELTDRELTRAEEALAAASQDVQAFRLEAVGLGTFPSRGQPRVVWVGLAGDAPSLMRFQERLESEAAQRGFSREPRPFKPHLTLGRVKSPHPRLRPLVEARQEERFGSFMAESLLLFKSELLPGGARYTPLQRVALAR